MINWLEKAQAYKDAFLNDLWAILEIPSIRNDDDKTDAAPFGTEVKRALDCFLGFAERDGFLTTNYNNFVGKNCPKAAVTIPSAFKDKRISISGLPDNFSG